MDAQTADAARLLFGFEPSWDGLQLAAVRQAFRKKAMELHPDRFANEAPQVQRTRTERFQKVSAAYEILLEVLGRRSASPSQRASPQRAGPARWAGGPGKAPRPAETQRTPRSSGTVPASAAAAAAASRAPFAARSDVSPARSRVSADFAGTGFPATQIRPSPGSAVDVRGPSSSRTGSAPQARTESNPTPGRVPPPRASVPDAKDGQDAPLPGIPFRLGTFLRRRGVVSAFDLAAALAEQSRSRTRLGDVAVHWKWLEREQADAIARNARPLERFGETAQRLGFKLTRDQVSRLLWYQRAQQRRLGEALVEKGALTRQRLEELMVELSRHNAQVRLRGGWEARMGPDAERMNQPL